MDPKPMTTAGPESPEAFHTEAVISLARSGRSRSVSDAISCAFASSSDFGTRAASSA
jgi:hypothetical protein